MVFELQKSEENGAGIIKAVSKGIVPVPTDTKSYALTLAGYLTKSFSYDPDIKFLNILKNLSCDRDVFIEYYKFMTKGHGKRVFNAYDLFTKLDEDENKGKYDLFQFIFCAMVFRQLGILSFSGGACKIHDDQPTALFDSPCYNMIRELDTQTIELELKKETTA